MHDPVMLSSGNTFEKQAIKNYFVQNGFKDPITGEHIDEDFMQENVYLKKSIESYSSEHKKIEVADCEMIISQ